jgi:hypothetical protein
MNMTCVPFLCAVMACTQSLPPVTTVDDDELICLTRQNYAEGTSIMTIVSSDHDRIDELFVHMILRHFTAKEARELRLVCREFRDNVDVTPFNDLTSPIGCRYTPIQASLALWHMCFPKAIAANVSYRVDLVDADVACFQGYEALNISQCIRLTDTAFTHLRGIRKLIMRNCDNQAITDAAFANLRGITYLDMTDCTQGSITPAAFLQLRGIQTLYVDRMRNPVMRAIDWNWIYRTDMSPGEQAVLEKCDPMWLRASTDENWTLLHSAARLNASLGGESATRILLERGADPTVATTNGTTPLHIVCDVAVAKLLLEYGADVNARTNKGTTPFMAIGGNNYHLAFLFYSHSKIK